MLAVLSKGDTCSHTSGFVGKSPGLEARSNAFDMTQTCGLLTSHVALRKSHSLSGSPVSHLENGEAAGPEGPAGSDIGMTVNA